METNPGVIEGVTSISAEGEALLIGAVTLSQGSNITLRQVGNDIEISSTGGGGSGTVTSVTSATAEITIANPTTTPVITLVSAPKLTTARTINGTSFDGTGDITITAAAGTLTGATLNASVLVSSLTSVGTLTSLTIASSLVVDTDTLVVDATNNRIGINVTSPLSTLHVNQAAAPTVPNVFLSQTSTTARAALQLINNGGNVWSFFGNNVFWNGSANVLVDSAKNGWAFYLNGDVTDAFYIYTRSTVAVDSFPLVVKSDGRMQLKSGAFAAPGNTQFDVTIATNTYVGQVMRGAASQSGDLYQAQNSSSVVLARITADGGFVFNENAADIDCRIEGDTDANLFFTDASTDRIGVGVATPASKLDVAGSFQCDSITNDTGIAAGTYTPTLTNIANLDASTAYECQYLRVGNTITVSGRVDIDPTLAATSTQLGISLPVASNLGAVEDCAGTAFASGVAGQGAAILGDATNNRAQLQYISGDVTNQAMYFTFTYQVI